MKATGVATPGVATAGGAAAVLLLLLLPTWISRADVFLVSEWLVIGLFVMSLGLLMGRGGMISFGHAAFLGLGAYAVALTTVRLGLSPWIALALSPLAGALGASLLAPIVARVGGLYLGLITLAITQVTFGVANSWYSVTGGENGVQGVPPLGGLADPVSMYYLILGIVVPAILVLYAIHRSTFARTLQAARDNQQRAETLGTWVGGHRMMAFVIAGAFAGLAGGLLAALQGQATPTLFFWTQSAEAVIAVLLGGLNVFLGPLIGGAVIFFGSHYLDAVTSHRELYLGITFAVVVLLLPNGLAGAARDVARRRSARRRQYGSPPDQREESVSAVLAGVAGDAGGGVPNEDRVGGASPRGPEGEAAGAGHDGRPTDERGAAIEIADVTQAFGEVQALDGYSLKVASGSIHAIIGPNGAGKSTVLNVLSGTVAPSAGRVLVKGRNVISLPAWRRAQLGIGRMFQLPGIFSSLTAGENVGVAVHAREHATFSLRRPDSRVAELGRTWLHEVGLAHRERTVASELSHGEERLLELAMVLALGTDLLLLDEPTAGLSPADSRMIVDLLQGVARRYGLTLVFTEHDMEVIFSLPEKVTVMSEGRALVEGSVSEVRRDPIAIATYLGAGAGSPADE